MYTTTIVFNTPSDKTFEVVKTISFIPVKGMALSFNEDLQSIKVIYTDYNFEDNTLVVLMEVAEYEESDFEGL